MATKLCPTICPLFQEAVDLLGRRWTHLILQALLERPRRFGELASALPAVSERMLSERLKELVAEGIVERRVIPETPVLVEYRLTEKGAAFGPVLEAIGTWAERWVHADAAPAAPEKAPKPRRRERERRTRR